MVKEPIDKQNEEVKDPSCYYEEQKHIVNYDLIDMDLSHSDGYSSKEEVEEYIVRRSRTKYYKL